MGTYLNYEIANSRSSRAPGRCGIFGGPSFVLKSQAGAVFTVDLYAGPSIFTDESYCGVCKTSGADKLWWMRLNPHVIDPWKFERLDAVCITHHHQDHMDFYTISAALETTNCKFIAPPEAARRMKKNMGVPDDRLIVAEVGESVQIADMKIDFAPNFDVIASKTGFDDAACRSKKWPSALSSTPRAATSAFLGDTLYHNGYRMVGEKYKIDVCLHGHGQQRAGLHRQDVALGRLAHRRSAERQGGHPGSSRQLGQLLRGPVVPGVHRQPQGKGKTPRPAHDGVVPRGALRAPDDMNIGRYVYPDWRDRMNWRKSVEYGEHIWNL